MLGCCCPLLNLLFFRDNYYLKISLSGIQVGFQTVWITGPCSAVSNVSGYRCVSDCRLMCLATDACLTADPGVASSIPAW